MKHEGSNPLALLEQLGNEVVPPMDAERRQAQRQRVSRAIEARARSSREGAEPQALMVRRPDSATPVRHHGWGRVRQFGWALGLAAGVALGASGWMALTMHDRSAPIAAVEQQPSRVQVVEGEVQVLRPGSYETRVSSAFDLDKGDTVQTAMAARAEVTLLADVHIELAAATRLRLGDTSQMSDSAVWLQQGRAKFDVAKRPPNGRFSVHSPDADVTVHGTSFTVEVRSLPSGLQTAVAVTEGLVSVASAGKTAWLHAGESWVSREDPPPVALPTLPTASAPSTVHAPVVNDAERVATSTLAAESRALEAAMSAKRRGDNESSLRQLDAFLTQYPNSPLAQNARVERFRLLKHLGRNDQAAAAAREYMASDPDGFARAEARGLTLPTDVATPASKGAP